MGPMPVHLKVRACCFQNEVKLLLELLPKYHAHVERYPHTLLIKFYGLHRVVPLNGSKVQTHGHTHTHYQSYIHCQSPQCARLC